MTIELDDQNMPGPGREKPGSERCRNVTNCVTFRTLRVTDNVPGRYGDHFGERRAWREDLLTDLFCTVVELAVARDVRRIADMEGCWEVELDGHWWLGVNGHRYAVRSTSPGGEELAVAGQSGVICRRGRSLDWVMVGWFTPYGTAWLGGWRGHEGALIEALNGAIGAAQG